MFHEISKILLTATPKQLSLFFFFLSAIVNKHLAIKYNLFSFLGANKEQYTCRIGYTFLKCPGKFLITNKKQLSASSKFCSPY